MLSFLDFINQKQITLPVSVLSWDGSFAAMRKSISLQPGMTAFPVETNESSSVDIPLEHTGTTVPHTDYDEIHTHPNIRPQNILPEHKVAIVHYVSTGSKGKNGFAASSNMNNYLRNRMGDKTVGIKFDQPEGRVKDSVRELSKAFTPENTNKQSVISYTGVPPKIGHQLARSARGSTHHLPGFTSTSTDFNHAEDYGQSSSRRHNDPHNAHVIQCHVLPGAGLSVATHSNYEDENEIVLHHGAKVTYNGTNQRTAPDGSTTHIHHVTVHPEHVNLDDYPEDYVHPAELSSEEVAHYLWDAHGEPDNPKAAKNAIRALQVKNVPIYQWKLVANHPNPAVKAAAMNHPNAPQYMKQVQQEQHD